MVPATVEISGGGEQTRVRVFAREGAELLSDFHIDIQRDWIEAAVRMNDLLTRCGDDAAGVEAALKSHLHLPDDLWALLTSG